MSKIEIEKIFLEILERWYGNELTLNQDWQMDDNINLNELTEKDYEDYKKTFIK